MNFHVLTLFPEMITQGLGVSIMGRAIEKNLISINAVNISIKFPFIFLKCLH